MHNPVACASTPVRCVDRFRGATRVTRVTRITRVTRCGLLALSGLLLFSAAGCKVVLASGDADPAQGAASQQVAQAPR